ncbi:MAG: efflux RND transporter permease subunit [Desulfobacteraceae bacterium]|nr:efflux RND transporter permease subunit [Desulfobacteraceae bacterium]
MKTAYNDMDITTYYEGDEDCDVTVKYRELDRRVTDGLHQLMIPTPNGQMVPLTTLAKIECGSSIDDITRMIHQRGLCDETAVPVAAARVKAQEMLRHFTLPPGYEVKFAGEKE